MNSDLALYAVSQIRAIERAALDALPGGMLMRRAGQAAAAAALRMIGEVPSPATVLVLAGPGNNGGDALEAACLLSGRGLQVKVVRCFDPHGLRGDAQQAWSRARDAAIAWIDPEGFEGALTDRYALVVDGLFGIGLARPIEGSLRHLVELVNQRRAPVLALDVPSGLDADTGMVVGQASAIRATETITFIANKPGLHTGDGRDYAGRVTTASLGIDGTFFPPPKSFLNSVALFEGSLKPRRQNSHKGSFGDVVVIGGAPGMSGAPILAARAAAFCGAGRVFAGFLADPPSHDPGHPELMCRRADEIVGHAGALVVGPGLGTSQSAGSLLKSAIDVSRLVLDADALNLVAASPDLAASLAARTVPAILTPHPLEAARLLDVHVAEIQGDRMAAARKIATTFNAIVLLKGSGSIIAHPDGQSAVNPTGNPALATAGSGDVLAGICGALLAQGWPGWSAAAGAVWLHGRAADVLVREGAGPIGLTAGELIPAARAVLNRLVAAQESGPGGSPM